MKTRSKATALTKAVVDSVIVQDDNDASEDESTRAKVVGKSIIMQPNFCENEYFWFCRG